MIESMSLRQVQVQQYCKSDTVRTSANIGASTNRKRNTHTTRMNIKINDYFLFIHRNIFTFGRLYRLSSVEETAFVVQLKLKPIGNKTRTVPLHCFLVNSNHNNIKNCFWPAPQQNVTVSVVY